MDSTNFNVHFRFDVLLHPRLFCLVINAADTCKYATNETRAFCAMDNQSHLTNSLKINFQSRWTHSLLSVLNFFQVKVFFSHNCTDKKRN